MTRWNGGWATAAVVTVMVGAAGCGGTDQSPLGGPYGGTSVPPGPTQGSSSSSSGSTASASPPADGGAVPESGGGGSSGSGSSSGSTSGSSGSSGGSAAAPTWSALYGAYLSSGSPGRCAGCHNQTSSASAAYSWLQSKGYINGASTTLDGKGSCLTWFGGNMPPGGSADTQAVTDIGAWAAAGALNN